MNLNPLEQHKNIGRLTQRVDNTFQANPFILITLGGIIFIYVMIFMFQDEVSGVPSQPSFQPYEFGEGVTEQISSMGIIEIILWVLFFFLVITNTIHYFFTLDVYANIKNLFSPVPEIEIDVKKKHPEPAKPKRNKYKKQVFHVPNNKYTYDESRALCKAYGGRLATYDEIKEAHNKGAEWCSYGWSEDQMAYFPTQKDTYDKLQKIEGHEHDCGRPGINGGHIANPNVRFGVNCFGYKPSITNKEMIDMENIPLYPKTEKDKELERRVKHFREKIDEIKLAPFNKTTWSVA